MRDGRRIFERRELDHRINVFVLPLSDVGDRLDLERITGDDELCRRFFVERQNDVDERDHRRLINHNVIPIEMLKIQALIARDEIVVREAGNGRDGDATFEAPNVEGAVANDFPSVEKLVVGRDETDQPITVGLIVDGVEQ